MSRVADEALAEALTWRGTTYRHQASVKGVGCDCLGLIRGVWRALHGTEPEPIPAYEPDWAEVTGEERMLAAARRWLIEKPAAAIEPGDVLLFRMAPEAAVKHCAILTRKGPPGRIVHAYWGRAVTESWLGDWWTSRIAAAFAFPEETD